MAAWRLLLRRRLPRDRVLRRTLPQLVALRRLRVLHDLPHLPARRRLIRRLIRPARRRGLRSLLHLHQRLLLQLLLHVPELRLLLLRCGPACRCDLQQHREARLREHVQRQQRLLLRVLLVHLQHCNAIRRVRERPVVRQDKRVQVRR